MCLQENCLVYSSYYSSLQGEDKYQYRMKIGLLGCIRISSIELGSAPRQQDLCTLDWQEWPEVQYPDIYNYLDVTHSVYIQDMLRAYKSLDACNLFVNGWVGNVCVLCLVCDQSVFLAFAEVRHSQSISKTPVKPWVALCTLYVHGRIKRSLSTYRSTSFCSGSKHSNEDESVMHFIGMFLVTSIFSNCPLF